MSKYKMYHNEAKQRINDHVMSYFTADHGWTESNSPKEALQEQLKSFDYMPTDYQKGVYMAEGGSFLVYYTDQRDFIKKTLEQTEEEANKYTDQKVFETYKHMVGKAVERLAKV